MQRQVYHSNCHKLVTQCPIVKVFMTLSNSLELEMVDKGVWRGLKAWKAGRGVILELHVKPNSREFRIQTENDELVVFCRETPFKGRVNRELIKELARLFHKKVEILSGLTSRQKKILIRDATIDEVSEILSEHVQRSLQSSAKGGARPSP